MARARPEKSANTNLPKTKPNSRKNDKPDIVGWLTAEDPDENDIESWMTRRIDGETRRDPRSAPSYNKFLWATKSKCRALENAVLFETDSLHASFSSPVQVTSKAKTGEQVQITLTKKAVPTLINNDTKRSSESYRLSKSKSASSVLPSSTVPTTNGNSNATWSTDSANATPQGDTSAATSSGNEARETEVTRLKRLISIARRHRLECSNGQQFDPTTNESNQYGHISVGSAVSNSTRDSGVSLDSLRSHFVDVDGVWALEYINDDGAYTNGEEQTNGQGNNSIRRSVKLSYTQREQGNSNGPPPKEDILGGLNIGIGDDEEETSLPSEATPFVTALTNYRTGNLDPGELKPQVRALRSARSSNSGLPEANEDVFKRTSQERTDGNVSGKQFAKVKLRNHGNHGVYSDRSTPQSNGEPDPRELEDSVKVERINIILPSNSPDLAIPPSIQKYLSSDHPASAIVHKMRQNGIRTHKHGDSDRASCGSARSSSRASSAVFPIGDMLPSAEASLDLSGNCRADERTYTRGLNEPTLAEDANITGKDLLMHHDMGTIYLGNRLYVISQPEHRILGPPPFRPQPCRTPLTRARETAQKRIYGQTFAQETKDLYHKLMSAKRGGLDSRPSTRSGRQRSDANHVLSKPSRSKESLWSRRPLGQTVSDTEFQEARAVLSAHMAANSLRRSYTEL